MLKEGIDTSYHEKMLMGVVLQMIADIVMLFSTKDTIRWVQLFIDFGGLLLRSALPQITALIQDNNPSLKGWLTRSRVCHHG
ncbi:hypothetical protein KDK_69410 [Dictyobacter kobayashii]|uniref:Uncharacterized protein n=1 Tax=Dictyobacter kobayashii TaxID=2014872 RepID=A0A402AVI4_9CHLR|nr:hypothetical protein KDK_69410 [Dictyobacter kobayashii]